MDIQSLSTDMSLAQVQQSAAVSVTAMGLNSMKEQAAGLNELLQSSQPVSDPNVGRNLDVTA